MNITLQIIDNIINLIELEISKLATNLDSISKIRKLRLNSVKQFLTTKGFPADENDKLELSLHPFYFQEVNYDDLDIYCKDGNLGQLANVYEIDLAVQTGGFTRDNVPQDVFDLYSSRRTKAIDYWQNKNNVK